MCVAMEEGSQSPLPDQALVRLDDLYGDGAIVAIFPVLYWAKLSLYFGYIVVDRLAHNLSTLAYYHSHAGD